MPKSQTVTSRNKKASSAATLKASHLTVVPTTNRNTAMNNSNALATNNQLPDKITLIIYQAQSTQQAVWSNGKALYALGRMLKQGVDSKNIEGIGHNIELLADSLMNWSQALQETLANGGFDNE